MDSDLAMAAVDLKFNSLLSEIQKSKLNFIINLTPYAAYVTLKKSTQVNIDGLPMSPYPPTLLLLEQCLSQKRNNENEIEQLKSALMLSEKQCQDLIHKNNSLRKELGAVSESLVKAKEVNVSVIKKAEVREKQLVQSEQVVKKLEDQLEASVHEISSFKKTLKSKEKELHNLTTKFTNSQDTNTNLRYELTQI